MIDQIKAQDSLVMLRCLKRQNDQNANIAIFGTIVYVVEGFLSFNLVGHI